MYPIVINGQSIEEIKRPSYSIRQHSKSFLPTLRLKLYTNKGYVANTYNNIKSYMFHKNGMMVIGINHWTTMPFLLKKLREMIPDVSVLACIHKQNFQGTSIESCQNQLKFYGIDSVLVDSWVETAELLDNYKPNFFKFGLQSNGYIAMLQGDWQVYNKVPGYTYPAKYMTTN